MPGVRLEPYCWPLRPFRRAHPVRGYLNDPRISGNSRAFHFGIDISAADGSPVFAVEGGTVHLEGRRSLSVVSPRSGRAFGYWHVVPAVSHHQQVGQQQLLGHVEAPWGHVHFAERWRQAYRNPLRRGGLAPLIDPSSPRIAAIQLFRGGRELSPSRVRGPVDVIVEAFDVPPLAVPAPSCSGATGLTSRSRERSAWRTWSARPGCWRSTAGRSSRCDWLMLSVLLSKWPDRLIGPLSSGAPESRHAGRLWARRGRFLRG